MLRAGIRILKKHGVSGLSVRDVVKEAGVNLGMFVYHFGTKEKFILRTLNEIYLGFLSDLRELQDETSNLESVLFQIAIFSRENRGILTAVLSDVLSSDKVVTLFLRKNFTRHLALLEDSLRAHLKQKKIKIQNTHHAVRFLIGAVGVPNILLEVYNRSSRTKESPESDDELQRRTKAAIIGLEAAFCETLKCAKQD